MLRTVLMAFFSLAVGYIILVVLIDGVLQDSFPAMIISLLMKFGMSQTEADRVYGTVFMQNKGLFVAVDSLAYQITFSEEGSFEKYIDDAYSRSVVKGNDIKVTAEDKIVTLSTCTGNESTRFIVQGKLSKTYWSKKK